MIGQTALKDLLRRKLEHAFDLVPAKDLGHLNQVIDTCEKAVIEYALHRLNGNQVKVAKVLDITRKTLTSRLKKYNLDASLEKHPP